MGCLHWRIHSCFFVLLMIFAEPYVTGFTDPRDVYALNSLYASLGFPPLPNWIPFGGDPCGLNWQGVLCVNSNITSIILNGANLGGELSEDLGSFASIIQIDLSNNHIGGSIPSNLPITMRSFSLSGNQLSGSIPDSLSSLGQLTDLSLNNNNLTGAVPDAFQQLNGLINMDLSGNSLSGQLPPSMGVLSSLTTLHLQNNRLTGTLDVLKDLPLRALNIENNLFSGPIPEKLLSIPDFRREGNPFNTTIIPSPPASSPSLPPSIAPSPHVAPTERANGPSASQLPQFGREGHNSTTKSVSWIAIAGLLAVVLLALGLCALMFKCCKRRKLKEKTMKKYEMGAFGALGHKQDQSLSKPHYQVDRESKEISLQQSVGGSKRKTALLNQEKDHSIDMTNLDYTQLPPRAHPLPLLPAERVASDPNFSPLSSSQHASNRVDSVKFFTIASLQQYTKSFSPENLIGEGTLGTVYKAELPGGKVLTVKKLNTTASRHLSDQKFLELVSTISKLQHANIVKLVGHCLEHGQRLLVYDYCRNGTLYEALHLDVEINKKLSWNARMHLALQAARALEYLHETCQPPIVHQNFKSANILLDDKLAVRVSDSGLAPLLPSDSMTQLQGHGYGAPELELGSYTYQSDVYSFGIVMLELLTGRKSYERSRPRGEQYLVRWANSRLHDIDALSRMVDPSLNGAYPSKSLSRLADIISLCIQREPEFRPPMSEIVQNLLHMIQRDS
ncbi:protein STRUBBELIG-RECEPTOR FAMILY 3-like [Olea europaea var. sylvestris]|uniref:protein STRUBBELIG-RECEPTOR FAMILY 3-like n=1 Tax=Olea europaea var. sylvestris TaxID=158386 RepID=UPI000C1D1E04|nr:protein STRUBBELIG-RECEPTOR FAMILY 3-like [Olea europaea var. sylvestris]XP_022848099.1 protein STRUBBELIG-RECEPTOR FAMILY 3-like [Olea europaea var. sylvestris]XP_022848100.1 protein STRUBBELIG-RECEPTOR FAMILY 3-like [Olea europaea var. sylvestris]